MNFLSKILTRAAIPGVARAPLARPKGGSWLARLDVGEEDRAQALHRQEDEEELQTLRRQDEEDQDSLQPLRRQEEEEENLQTLRRQEQEDEESLQPLRRQEEEEEESAQPLRRQEQEEEESAHALRRVTAPDAQQLTAENSPQPDDLDPEPAMPTLRALHREALAAGPENTTAGTPAFVDTTPGQEAPALPAAAWTDGSASIPEAQDHFIPAPRSPERAAERPRVVIDQIDVVIHEEAAAMAPASPTAALSRALKTKYLRGL